MKKKHIILTASLLFLAMTETTKVTLAISGTGTVEYTGELSKEPVDPEDPLKPVDPGETPTTDGELRFEFAPVLNFGRNAINENNRKFYANAQLFHDGSPARGNFLQITDARAEQSGWTLQVRQEYQFKNDVIQENNEKELKGAVLSFDKAWANSAYTQEQSPQISKDIIQLNVPGVTFPVATAEQGQGKGTWIISFGASKESKEQENTLFPKVDEKNQPILDEQFDNQQVYENHAIFLSVPQTIKIHPVQYQTELTWILAELP